MEDGSYSDYNSFQSKFDVFGNENGDIRINFNYEYPKPGEIHANQKNYIKNYFYEFESSLASENFKDAGERVVLSQMSKIDRYKCAVFKDLHEKGFTMTSAAKFGGDYLAYPGDPMLFHAYFTVRVLERGEKMTPLSCSSVTRMAHAARKNVVFAFCGEEEGEEKNTDGGKSSANNNNVLRIRYFTCVPDIELSSNRGF